MEAASLFYRIFVEEYYIAFDYKPHVGFLLKFVKAQASHEKIMPILFLRKSHVGKWLKFVNQQFIPHPPPRLGMPPSYLE